MLFRCLWRNVETSCHKHFAVVSHYQQAPPLTISDKCHNLRDVVRRLRVDNTCRSQHWQHALKPDIGSESRFLPTPPAFDAPVRGGGSVGILFFLILWYCSSAKIIATDWTSDVAGDLRKKIEDQNGIFFDEQVVFRRSIRFHVRLIKFSKWTACVIMWHITWLIAIKTFYVSACRSALAEAWCSQPVLVLFSSVTKRANTMF